MRSLNKKGQFSIIAALLVSIVLVTAIITTYSLVNNNPLNDRPQILGTLDEMNSGLNRILGFAVGYYGSILQITGNTTYAKRIVNDYIQGSLENIAATHPQWNPTYQISKSRVSASWFSRTSFSEGNLALNYSLLGLGIHGIRYESLVGLKITVNPSSTSYVIINASCDGDNPCENLRSDSFFFYDYSYDDSVWRLKNTGVTINSVSSTEAQSAYNISIPEGIDSSSYMLQVVDLRGIAVVASTFSSYTYNFDWSSTGKESIFSELSQDTIVVEVLQNSSLRWLGQNLQLTTIGKPVPPIPVKAFRINQTIDGISREVPFQVEDWGSNYRVPTGLTSNATIFSSRQMLVFLVNDEVDDVILWWDGRDVANQTPYAFTNKYFTGDNPSAGILTNGILSLRIVGFDITSTVGSATSIAKFMRINGEIPTYGANLAYTIHHGIVRDVIHQEAEWSGGVSGCPNVYSQIVVTLPANATYYTYSLRTIFVDSSQSRIISDLSPIQLSSGWLAKALQTLTENGTSSGYPIIAETIAGGNDLFYNFSSPSTSWMHHWSEYIYGSAGGGIMFTDSTNRRLYAFDNIAGSKTGALNVATAQRVSWKTPIAIYSRCGADSGYPASSAIDKSTSTSWRHSTIENHWIILDLGETMSISRIRIYQSYTESDRWGQSSGIEVYVSDDPNSWGSSVWIGTLNAGGWQPSGAFSAQGRYVRLYSRSTSSSQRLYEVEVEAQERQATIEFNPVERFQASFTYPLDLIWHGAVVTFEEDPIYPTSGNAGLWVIVESPPTVSVNATD